METYIDDNIILSQKCDLLEKRDFYANKKSVQSGYSIVF